MRQVLYFQAKPERAVWVKDVEIRDGQILYETEWKRKTPQR